MVNACDTLQELNIQSRGVRTVMDPNTYINGGWILRFMRRTTEAYTHALCLKCHGDEKRYRNSQTSIGVEERRGAMLLCPVITLDGIRITVWH